MNDKKKIFYFKSAPPIGVVDWAVLAIFMTSLIAINLLLFKTSPDTAIICSIIMLLVGAIVARYVYSRNKSSVPPLIFYEDSFEAPTSIHSRTVVSTRYESVSHVDVSDGGTRKILIISTENHTLIYPTQRFAEDGDEKQVIDFLRTQMSQGVVGDSASNKVEERRDVAHIIANRRLRVTFLTCIILIAVFLFSMEMTRGLDNIGIAVRSGANISFLVFEGEFFRLIDANLLHYDATHLVGNIFSFFLFGRIVERQLGEIRFLFLILLSGIASQLVSSIWMHAGTFSNHVYSEGFSGVVFGVIGAFAVISVFYKDKLPTKYKIKSVDLIYLLILSFLLSPWMFPEIDVAAHFGGLISGVAIAYIMCLGRQNIFSEAKPKLAFQGALIFLCLIWVIGIGDTARYNLDRDKWRADRDAAVQYTRGLHRSSLATPHALVGQRGG